MENIDILLVEDNEGDIELTMEALKQARIFNRVIVARDGEAAISLLQNSGKLPDLILLDINLPKMDGMEVLKVIKTDPKFKMIPVIVLTTSSADNDISRSYGNHANCFITKPVDLDLFMGVVRNIENFWISIVRLPNK